MRVRNISNVMVRVGGVSLGAYRTRSISLDEWTDWLQMSDSNRFTAATMLLLEPEEEEEYVPEPEPIPDTVNMPDPEPEEEEIPFDSVFDSLDPENPEHFTKSGVPRIPVLTKLMGRLVTSSERDAAWESYSMDIPEDDDASNGA